MLQRWLIVISGPRLIEEVRRLPDDQVSFIEALEEVYFYALLNNILKHPSYLLSAHSSYNFTIALDVRL